MDNIDTINLTKINISTGDRKCVIVCVHVCMHMCVCYSGGGDGESGEEMKSHQGQGTSQLINNFSK